MKIENDLAILPSHDNYSRANNIGTFLYKYRLFLIINTER